VTDNLQHTAQIKLQEWCKHALQLFKIPNMILENIVDDFAMQFPLAEASQPYSLPASQPYSLPASLLPSLFYYDLSALSLEP
jgi:hypothetical protein